MPVTLLLVRSVSFQHLDWVLSVIREKWPGALVTLLTHPHGCEAALKTKGIDAVWVYPKRGDFSFWAIGKIKTRRERFDHLIVPFSNCSGAGFDNVIAMAFRLPALGRWTLPLNGSPTPLRYGWWIHFGGLMVLKGIALLATLLAYPVVLLFTSLVLGVKRLKGAGKR